MTPPVIMWFRQDLRPEHNAALNAAAAAGPVIALYILDDETPAAWRMAGASRWWLHHSLKALGQNFKLTLRRGKADAVLAQVIAETGAAGVYFTRDYAPWSPALEQRVKSVCEAHSVGCHRYGGFLLHEPERIANGTGEPYKIYTPFSHACFAAGEPRLSATVTPEIWPGAVASEPLESWNLLPHAPDWAQGFAQYWRPGHDGAQVALAQFVADGLPHYAEERNRPDRPSTSRLSPYLHFGDLSIAQCWLAVRHAQAQAEGKIDQAAETFLKELLWREFSNHLLFHWPELTEQPFRPAFADFPWGHDAEALKRWQRGLTGYPIIDAGMRELWATGTMHNRVRMIVASFLTKHLLQHWHGGAKWFWDCLLDADIASNSVSWQWVAGCGADAAPYFRIFNPVLQGVKFDPSGTYVRRWVPEVARLPDKLIHTPWEATGLLQPVGYPMPIIALDAGRDRALQALASLKAEA